MATKLPLPSQKSCHIQQEVRQNGRSNHHVPCYTTTTMTTTWNAKKWRDGSWHSEIAMFGFHANARSQEGDGKWVKRAIVWPNVLIWHDICSFVLISNKGLILLTLCSWVSVGGQENYWSRWHSLDVIDKRSQTSVQRFQGLQLMVSTSTCSILLAWDCNPPHSSWQWIPQPSSARLYVQASTLGWCPKMGHAWACSQRQESPKGNHALVQSGSGSLGRLIVVSKDDRIPETVGDSGGPSSLSGLPNDPNSQWWISAAWRSVIQLRILGIHSPPM